MCCFIYFDQIFTKAFRSSKQAVASVVREMAFSSLVRSLAVMDKMVGEEEEGRYYVPLPEFS